MIGVARFAFIAGQTLVGLAVAYLFVLGAAAVLGGRRLHHVGALPAPRTSFLVVVPAHDEELTLGRLLDSITSSDYPRSLLRVLVVADNCTDRTAETARGRGVRCWDRRDGLRHGKGYALDWALRRLAAEGERCDAFVVIDADSEVEPRFFRFLDAETRRSPGVLQAHYDVLNPGDTAFTAVTKLAFSLQQYVKPLGRTVLGLSPRLLGNGMCFPAAMLAGGWKATSISEDLNHYVALVRAGQRTRLVPDALVRAEMPRRKRSARSQRVRWEKGKLLAMREQVPSLLKTAVFRRDLAVADAALDIAMPPFSTLAASLIGLGVAGASVPALRPAFSPAAWAVQVLLLFAYVSTGAVLVRIRPAVLLRSVVAAPAFLVWKLWIQALALTGMRDRRWVRTPRTVEAGERR